MTKKDKTTPPKAILFDWDNTLVDTWPTIHAALTHTFESMGHEPWSMEQVKAHVHRSMKDSFPEIFGDRWQHAAKIYQQNFRDIHLHRLEALPLAEEVLKLLQGSDLFVGLVSNKTNVNLHKEVQHIGWEPYFHKVVGANDAKLDKPSHLPVELVLKDSGVKAGKEVWFIGDSITDMECAHNSGCIPIMFGMAHDITQPPYVYFPPTHRVADHVALQKLLRDVVL